MKLESVVKLISFLVLLFLSLGNAFAGHHESDGQDAPAMIEVQRVVDQYTEALERGDSALFASLMADDEMMITFGTDAAERWVGKRSLMASFEKQISAFDIERIDVSDQVIRLSQSETTAWFSELADWHVQVGGKTDVIQGIRITGVLEKQAGGWKIVQFHTSAPVAGQIVEY